MRGSGVNDTGKPIPFAGLMTMGIYSHIAARSFSGHTAAASSIGWPVPCAFHDSVCERGLEALRRRSGSRTSHVRYSPIATEEVVSR